LTSYLMASMVFLVLWFVILIRYFNLPLAALLCLSSFGLGVAFPFSVVHMGLQEALVLYGLLIPITGMGIFLLNRHAFEPAPASVEGTTGPTAVEATATTSAADDIVEKAIINGQTASLKEDIWEKARIEEKSVDSHSEPADEFGTPVVEEPLVEVAPEPDSVFLDKVPVEPDTEQILEEAAAEAESAEEVSVADPEEETVPVPSPDVADAVRSEDHTATEPQLSSEDLVSMAVRLTGDGEYEEAMRLLERVLLTTPAVETLCLAVVEMSTVYQHLGQYRMASDLLKVFLDDPETGTHPLSVLLSQKMRFSSQLDRLLREAGTPELPYRQVPAELVNQAFNTVTRV